MSERTVQLQAGGTKFSVHDTKFSTYLLEYCTIVKENIMYKQILADFSFDDGSGDAGSSADAKKRSRENVI